MYLPPAGSFLCHLLGLKGVHAGQAANLRLIKYYSASGLSTGVI
jgi:hypothetical protein